MKTQFKIFICMVALTLCACGGKNSDKSSPSGGSSDGGGSVIGSRSQEVHNRISELKTNLHELAHRARYWSKYDNDIFWSAEAEKILASDQLDLVIDNMTIFESDQACKSSDRTHMDGSANLEKQTVCISAGRLTNVPPKALRIELLALGMHEVAHLMGANEELALQIQRWVIDYNEITDINESKLSYEVLLRMVNSYTELGDLVYFATKEKQDQLDICRAIAEAKEDIGWFRYYVGTGSKIAPDKMFGKEWGWQIDKRYGMWTQNYCYDAIVIPQDKLQKLIVEANEVRALLKDGAQKLLEYDSRERRYQYIVNIMK